jgi:hypothetical protein
VTIAGTFALVFASFWGRGARPVSSRWEADTARAGEKGLGKPFGGWHCVVSLFSASAATDNHSITVGTREQHGRQYGTTRTIFRSTPVSGPSGHGSDGLLGAKS